LRLEVLKFAHQHVVFRVADARLVENVVAIGVLIDLFAQFLDAPQRRAAHGGLSPASA